MDGQNNAVADRPAADGQTNRRRDSVVEARIAPEPLVFYRPETNDLLIVPANRATAFENECRLLDRVMQDFHDAKEMHLEAQEALLEAQRAAEGPDRTVPQSPQVVLEAERALATAENALVDAQKKVEDEFKPLGQLDGTSGKLFELVPIARRNERLPSRRESGGTRTRTDRDHRTWARKWSYARADKIQNSFRAHNLTAAEQAQYQSSGKNSAITQPRPQVAGQGRLNNPPRRIDTGKLAEQLTTLDTSVKWREDLGSVQGVLLEDLNRSIKASLEEWAEGVNAGNEHVELGAEAQILRYFAGAGITGNWNPRKGNMAVRGDARAEFAIAEGKFKAAAYWPSPGGHRLQMTGARGTLHELGLIRLGAELELFGLVGASACLQLGLEVDYSGGGGAAGARGKSSAKPLSSEGLNLSRQIRDGGEASAAADLFVGARAGGSVKGSLQWNSPEAQKFESLCKIGPGGQVQAGAGIAGQFRIDYVNGKFRFLASAAVCWGVGAGGKLEFEVDAAHTFEFIKYLAYTLYAVGYEFLDLLTERAFEAWANFSLWAIQQGKNVVDAIEEFGAGLDQALETVQAMLEVEAERAALMNRVLANPSSLEYAPPETKGMILYQLTRHGVLTKANPANYQWNSPDTIGRRKEAVLTVCRKARSRSEFRNICQHMTANGSEDPAGWEENYAHLQRFLNMGIDTQDRDRQLRDFESNLVALYRGLYEEPVLGYPFVDNDSPQYAMRVLRGHHDGYLVAGGYNPGSPFPTIDSEDTGTRYA